MFSRSTSSRSSPVTAAGLALAALLIAISTAKAGTVFSSNFSAGDGFTLTTATGTNTYATGFTTGTDVNFLELSAVKLSLQAISGTANPVVRLFSSTTVSGTKIPDSPLITLSGTTFSNVTPQTFTFTGSYQMVASTDYWVVLSAAGSGSFQWENASDNPPTEANTSGYAAIGGRRQANPVSSWTANLPASTALVEVQAIPEPSTIMLAGLGIVGVAVANRTRRLRRARATASGHDTVEDSNVDG